METKGGRQPAAPTNEQPPRKTIKIDNLQTELKRRNVDNVEPQQKQEEGRKEDPNVTPKTVDSKLPQQETEEG